MKKVPQKSKASKLNSHNFFIYVLGALTFLLQIHTFFGEDIVNARNNYLTGSRTDFWGGMSTLIYSNIPSFGVRWQIWLALFQITLTTIALTKLVTLKSSSKISQAFKILLSYFSLLFGSQLTRDGLMFSLLVLGVALLKEAFQENHPLYKSILPSLLILSGITFRPWLSIALIPIVIIISRRYKKSISRATTVIAILAISTLPLAAEISITRSLKLVESYPEQQVMIMDVAASYCYTNNLSTGIRAMSAIQLFSSNSDYSKSACQLYRPDTWLSLTKAGNVSASGIESDFWIIRAGDSDKYEKVKSIWIEMILRDPVTYLQNKIIFGGKLIIGSDSRNITFLNEQSTKLKLLALYKLPYELAITFHLFSILGAMGILLIGPFSRLFRRESRDLVVGSETLLLLLSLITWLSLSSIAYIGSNGRYTYTISLLALLLSVSLNSEDKEHQD